MFYPRVPPSHRRALDDHLIKVVLMQVILMELGRSHCDSTVVCLEVFKARCRRYTWGSSMEYTPQWQVTHRLQHAKK
jgi:hypothetical protein